MRDLCAKLVIVAGVVLTLNALIRTVASAIYLFEILAEENHYVSWTYYVWTPTNIVHDWSVAIAFILVGFALLSKPGK